MLVFMRGAEIGIGGRPHAAGLPDGSQKAPGGGTVHVRPHSGCGIALVRRRRESIMTAVGVRTHVLADWRLEPAL